MTKKRQSKTLLNPTLDSITKQKSKPTSKATKNQNKNSVVAKQNKGKKLPCERKHASKSPAARTATGRVSVIVKKHKDAKGGHPHVIMDDIDDKHVSVGLTTDKSKGKNHPNIELEKSPLPLKQGKKSYMRRQGTVDLKSRYGASQIGELTTSDFEKAKKIAKKAKDRYLTEKKETKK